MAKLIRFITMEEGKKIISKEIDKRFKLAYALALGSGLRISEVVGYLNKIKPLYKDQIDLQAHTIRVFGKGGKERITVTSPFLNETNIKLLPLKINRRRLQRRISKLGKEVLGRKITFHTLRHGFANFMVNEKNVPLPMVQVMLGHSRLDTTGIYTKSNPIQAINTAWEKFE
jgi:site-specific recombinase XerC